MITKQRATLYDTVSGRFRSRRNASLFASIEALSAELGRQVRVLDVGGVESFWIQADMAARCSVILLNTAEAFTKPYWFPGLLDAERVAGTALDLRQWHGQVDFVVCNSVIEHVGRWDDILLCAAELAAVAPSGWVQTPAFGFPIEPHFALPFIHWFSDPIRSRLLDFVPHHGRSQLRGPDVGRREAEKNNLLTQREFRSLFPAACIRRERLFGLTKSFVAEWGLPASSDASVR